MRATAEYSATHRTRVSCPGYVCILKAHGSSVNQGGTADLVFVLDRIHSSVGAIFISGRREEEIIMFLLTRRWRPAQR